MTDGRDEFRSGWPTLLGATAAVSTGAAIFNFTATLFVTSIQNELAWSRGQIGMGITITLIVSACLQPLMGYLADKLGSRMVGGAGLIAFSMCCFWLAVMMNDLGVYYAVSAILGFGFSASTAVIFAPLVVARFKQNRGLALGIMLSGPAMLLIPVSPVLTNLIAQSGWRAGYAAIGLGALVIGLPGLLLAARGVGAAERAESRSGAGGMDVADALRTVTYWKLSIGAFLSAVALGGFLNQYAPLFDDKGLSAGEIGVLASMFVGAVLVGNFSVGCFLDRVCPPIVSMVAMLGAAVGALLTLQPDATLSSAAVSLGLIACAFGAEGEILAFFVAREFGLKRFSTIFATLAVMTQVGFGLGAQLFGRLRDLNGNYTSAIHAALALFLVGAFLFGMLPRDAGRSSRADHAA